MSCIIYKTNGKTFPATSRFLSLNEKSKTLYIAFPDFDYAACSFVLDKYALSCKVTLNRIYCTG